MPANCQLWGCDVASMCDFLFSDSLKILLTGEKLAHKFGGNNLSWWKQPKLVETTYEDQREDCRTQHFVDPY